MPRALLASRALALVLRSCSTCTPLQSNSTSPSALILRWAHSGRDRPPLSANWHTSATALPGPPRHSRFLCPPSSITASAFSPVEELLLKHCGSISLQELLVFARLPDADRSQSWHGALKRAGQHQSSVVDQAPYLHEKSGDAQKYAQVHALHVLAEEAGAQHRGHGQHAFWSALCAAMEATHFQQVAAAQAEEVLALSMALCECGVRHAGVWRACLSRVASCQPAPALEDLLAVIEGAALAGVPCPPEAAAALIERMCQLAMPASPPPPAATHVSTAELEGERSMSLDPSYSLQAWYEGFSADGGWAKLGPDSEVGQQGEAGRMGGPGSSSAAAWAEDLAIHNKQQQQWLHSAGPFWPQPGACTPGVIADTVLARIAHAAGFCAQSLTAQGGMWGGRETAKAGGSKAAGAGNEAAHSSDAVPGIEGVGENTGGVLILQQQCEQQQQQQQQQQHPWLDLPEPVAASMCTNRSPLQLWPAQSLPSAQKIAAAAGAPTASARCVPGSDIGPYGGAGGAPGAHGQASQLEGGNIADETLMMGKEHRARGAAEVFLPACQLLWAGLPGMTDVRSLLQVALAASVVPGSMGAPELASAACARAGVLMQGQLAESSAALPAALRRATQRARWHALSRRRRMNRADANAGLGSVSWPKPSSGAGSDEARSTQAFRVLEGAHGAAPQWELVARTPMASQSLGRWLPGGQQQRRLGSWQRLILQLRELEHQLHAQLQQQQQSQGQQQPLSESFGDLPGPQSQQQGQPAWAQQAMQEHRPPSSCASALSSESLGSDRSRCAVSTGAAATSHLAAAATTAAASTAPVNPAASDDASLPLWRASQRIHQQQPLQLVQVLQGLRDTVLPPERPSPYGAAAAAAAQAAVDEGHGAAGSQRAAARRQPRLDQAAAAAAGAAPATAGMQLTADPAGLAAHPVPPAFQEVQDSILQALQAQFEQAAVDLGPSMLLLPYSNVASPVHEPSPGRGPAAASTAQHQRGHLRHTTTETPPGGGSAGATEVQHQREDLRHTTTETPLGRGSAGQLLHAWEVLGDIYYPPIWVARPELADAWLRAARAAMVAGLADVGEICKIARVASGLPPCLGGPHASTLHERPQGPFNHPTGTPDSACNHHPPHASVSPGVHQDQQQRQQHSAPLPPLFPHLQVPLSQQLQLLEAAGAALHHQPHPPSASCPQLATLASAAWAARKAHALHRTQPSSSSSINLPSTYHRMDTSPLCASHTKTRDSSPSHTSPPSSALSARECPSPTPALHSPLPSSHPSLPTPAASDFLQAEADSTLLHASLHLTRPLWPSVPLQLHAIISWMAEAAGAMLDSARPQHSGQSLFAGGSPSRAKATGPTPPLLFHHQQGSKELQAWRCEGPDVAAAAAPAGEARHSEQGPGATTDQWAAWAKRSGASGAAAPSGSMQHQQYQQQVLQQHTLPPAEVVRQLGLPAVAALLNLTSSSSSSCGRGAVGAYAGLLSTTWTTALSAAAANQVVRIHRAWMAESCSHVGQAAHTPAPAPVGPDTILDLAAVLKGKRVHLALQDWACAHLRAAHRAAAAHKVLGLPWQQLRQQPQDFPRPGGSTQPQSSRQLWQEPQHALSISQKTPGNANTSPQLPPHFPCPEPPQPAAAPTDTPCSSLTQRSSPEGALNLSPSPLHLHSQPSSSPSLTHSPSPLSPQAQASAPDRPDFCAQLQAAHALNGAALHVEALLAGWPEGVKLQQGLVDAICAAAAAPVLHIVTAVGLAKHAKRLRLHKGSKVPRPAAKQILALQATVRHRVHQLWGEAAELEGDELSSRWALCALEATQQLTKAQLQRLLLGLPELGLQVPPLLRAAVEHRWAPSAASKAASAAPAPTAAPAPAATQHTSPAHGSHHPQMWVPPLVHAAEEYQSTHSAAPAALHAPTLWNSYLQSLTTAHDAPAPGSDLCNSLAGSNHHQLTQGQVHNQPLSAPHHEQPQGSGQHQSVAAARPPCPGTVPHTPVISTHHSIPLATAHHQSLTPCNTRHTSEPISHSAPNASKSSLQHTQHGGLRYSLAGIAPALGSASGEAHLSGSGVASTWLLEKVPEPTGSLLHGRSDAPCTLSTGDDGAAVASKECMGSSMHAPARLGELRHDLCGGHAPHAAHHAQHVLGDEAQPWLEATQHQELQQQQQQAPSEQAAVLPPPGSPTLLHQAQQQQQLSHLLGHFAGALAPKEHKLPSHQEWVSLLRGLLLQLKPTQPAPPTTRAQPLSMLGGSAQGRREKGGHLRTDDARTRAQPLSMQGGWAQRGKMAGSFAKGSAAKGSVTKTSGSSQQGGVPQAVALQPYFVDRLLQGLQPVLGRLSTNTLVQVLDLVSQLAPCPPDPTSPLAASSSSSGSSSKAMRGKTCGHHRQLQQYQGLEELQKGQQQGQQTEQARPVDQQHERQQQQQLGQQQQRVEQLRRGRGPQGTTILPGPAGPKAPSSDAPFSAGPTPRSFYSSFYAIAAAVVVRNLRTKLGHLRRQRAACASARAAARLSSKYGQVARLATYAACSLRRANSRGHEELLFLLVEMVVQEQAFDALPTEVAAAAEWALSAPHFTCVGCPHYSTALTMLRGKLARKGQGASTL